MRLALITLLLASIGCVDNSWGPAIKGSGVAKTEERDVAAFKRIQIDGGAKVKIDVGPQHKQSLSVEADDNILPLIETSVNGDTLLITSKQSISPKVGVKLTITVPALDGVKVNGSGDITANGIAATQFDVDIRGSGDVKLAGTADALSVKISGSGDVDATRLTTADATVHVSGSGDVKVDATKTLDVHISGAGDVRYLGDPQVTKQIMGSGSVKKI